MIFKNTTALAVIAEGVTIEGKLDFPCSVKIDGDITVNTKSEGILTIGKNAKIKLNIKTKMQ